MLTEVGTKLDVSVFEFTGGLVPNATRIDSACFLDGNEDEYIVEFWALPGSILRTCYNRRDTSTKESFVPVNSWEYSKLRRMADASQEGCFYSI